METDWIFHKRLSSLFSLGLVVLIASLVSVWILTESKELKKLEQPVPNYIEDLWQK